MIFAGRDLSEGGSWLGVTTTGRFAAVTNFAEETADELAPKSRGALVAGFLSGERSAHDYAHSIHGLDYKGFNLLLYEGRSLVYTCNRGFTEDLSAGIYGLANAELGARWPKVTAGTEALASLHVAASPEMLIELLADDSQPPDSELPKRGRPLELERRAAPCFIRGDEYGTRSSTAVIFENDRIHFAEQNYLAGGTAAGNTAVTLQICSS